MIYENATSLMARARSSVETLVSPKTVGFKPSMAQERTDILHTSYRWGMQLNISFQDTKWQRPFDNALEVLLAYARSGDKRTGWYYGQRDTSPSYGTYRVITLPSGESFEIIDENIKGVEVGQASSVVSIRPDYDGLGPNRYVDTQGRRLGCLYMHGGGESAASRKRVIEVCGTDLDTGTQGVVERVKQIAAEAQRSL